jgi:hypothetical protein
MSRLIISLCLSATLVGGSAVAQDGAGGSDWDYAEDAGRNLSVASVEYSNGASLIVQCLGGDVTVGIGGLPEFTSSPVRLERQ